MTCRFAHDDGAYVLGALSPAERLDYERHLPGCGDCTRAVGELAGLPGLLGRVDARLVEDPPATDPVPDTLLPALFREVRRRHRRRNVAAVGLAAAGLAAATVALLGPQLGGPDGSGPTVPDAPSAGASEVPTVAMEPVGEVPLQARVSLEQVTWGTRLGLVCTYDPASVEYDLPPEVDYLLFVRTREGRAERVGSWRSVGGLTMRLSAATAADRDEIESVEVRTPEGRVVLELSL